MAPSGSPRIASTRDLREHAGLAVAVLAVGFAVAVALLAWRVAGNDLVALWGRIPLEMRVSLQVSLLVAGVGSAGLALHRAWREYAGRARARVRARENAPIFEFSAGSVTAAALARGDALDEPARRFLAENRRKYLIRPRDAMSRPRRDWGAPVLFAEPTRAGDSRLQPAMALALTERRRHQRNFQSLLGGTGQLSAVRVILGVGKGYTSLTRAHALREDLGRIPAKLRVNCIVTDPPSSAEAAAEMTREADFATSPVLLPEEVGA